MNAQVFSLLNSGSYNESYKLANEMVKQNRNQENLQDRFSVLQAMIDIRLERHEIDSLPRVVSQMVLDYDASIDYRQTEKALKSISFYLILQRTRYQHSKIPIKILNELVKIPHLIPSEIHSLILTASLYYKSDFMAYLEFAEAWGGMSFTTLDFQKRSNKDGKRYCSLAESYLAYICKCLELDLTNHIIPSTSINPEIWLKWAEFADKQGFKSDLMPFYRSVVYKLNGQVDEAISSLKKFITHKPFDFWVWSRMAEFIEEDTLKLSFLAKAVSCPGPEEYKIRVHYNLGLLFLRDKLYSEALHQFETTTRISETNHWAKLLDIDALIETCKKQTSQSIKADYSELSRLAEEFVYSSSKGIWAYLLHHSKSGGKTILTFRNQKGVEIEVQESASKNEFLSSDLFNLVLDRRKDGMNRILYKRRFKEDDMDEDLRIVFGIIRKSTKDEFGFLTDVFIPPYIFVDNPELKNGASTKLVAQKAFDKKMNREGWRAIGILSDKK